MTTDRCRRTWSASSAVTSSAAFLPEVSQGPGVQRADMTS